MYVCLCMYTYTQAPGRGGNTDARKGKGSVVSPRTGSRKGGARGGQAVRMDDLKAGSGGGARGEGSRTLSGKRQRSVGGVGAGSAADRGAVSSYPRGDRSAAEERPDGRAGPREKQSYAMGTKVRMCFDSGKLYLEQYVGTIIKFDAWAEQKYTVHFEDGDEHVTNITGDPDVEVCFNGVWWQVCDSEYLGRRVRRAVYAGHENRGHIVGAGDGTIVGWMPSEVSDFVSEFYKKPAALWHMVYDSEAIGEEDLEEFEVRHAIESYSQDIWADLGGGEEEREEVEFSLFSLTRFSTPHTPHNQKLALYRFCHTFLL